MIFSNRLDDKVRDGTKTQTRRLVKQGDYVGRMWRDPVTLIPDKTLHKLVGRVYRRGRRKWVVGRTYAIQPGRGKKGDGRFRITKIRKERLQDISEYDAIDEGVSGIYKCTSWLPGEARQSFKRLWDSIHKKPGDRWASNPSVWVLEIELV